MLVAYNKTSKKVSVSPEAPKNLPEGTSLKDLEEQIQQLNTLSQQLISMNGDIPTGPEPTKSLSMAVKGNFEAGTMALKSGKPQDAIKHFTEGLEKCTKRNKWEAFQLTLFETQLCLMSRTDAYLLCGKFLEALQDADILIRTMSCTPDNFYRRSIAYLQLGFLDKAKADLERGLAFSPGNDKLEKQLKFVKGEIDKENGDA